MSNRAVQSIDELAAELGGMDQALELLKEQSECDYVDPPAEPMKNARRFIAAQYGHGDRDLLVFHGGVFFAWNGTCYPEVDDHELRSRLYAHFENALFFGDGGKVKPFAPNRYKVTDLLDTLRGIAHIPTATTTPTWLDNGEYPADEIIPCRNGLLHYPTRTLHPHTPCFYSHHSLSFDFSATARPARWLEFLNDLWGDDEESKQVLQELFGYIVSGDTRLQKMFMLVGPKRSGKGTIARVLKEMIGQHNVAGPTLASLGTNFGLQPLIGKPVAIIADARLKSSDTSVVTERLLSISGEDVQTVDRKYRDPWTGQLPSRILLLSNELPRLSDSSGALASRFIMLMMNQSFYGRENPNLTSELCAELPGILNWALDGLERLRERGYFVSPDASRDAVRELEDLGSPVGAFIRDECSVDPSAEVLCDELYTAWRQWCEDHGRRATSSQIFGRDLRSAVPGIRVTQPRRPDGSRPRTYAGIGLARAGTGASALYPPVDELPETGRHNPPERVPPRASRYEPPFTDPDDSEV